MYSEKLKGLMPLWKSTGLNSLTDCVCIVRRGHVAIIMEVTVLIALRTVYV